ncbi:MAG: hemolysin III family protein [Chloroflexi bacterium]|nr:hemolysin III family protein [Chloroflexota bacterium]
MHQGKPLMRGWFHIFAALGSVAATVGLLLRTLDDPLRLLSLLVFGLSTIELYTVSAIYHVGWWKGRRRTVLRALDHANIFVLIAGTYTPICVNVLSGWLRIALLALIWLLALVGVAGAVFTLRLPRWVSTGLYIVMGWVALIPAPVLIRLLPWEAIGLLVGGGVLYTVGALFYALKRPNPFPRVFGYHEIFHLFVIAGGTAFVVMIWGWVVPFPRS